MAYQPGYPQNFPEQGPNNQPLLANNGMVTTEVPPTNQYAPNQYAPNQYAPNQYAPNNQYVAAPQYPAGQPQMVAQVVPQVVYVQAVPNTEGLPMKPIGRQAQRYYCPICRKPQVSRVNYQMGLGGWVWCLLCVCGVSCLPCCVEDMQDAIHHCPECQSEAAKDVWLC